MNYFMNSQSFATATFYSATDDSESFTNWAWVSSQNRMSPTVAGTINIVKKVIFS